MAARPFCADKAGKFTWGNFRLLPTPGASGNREKWRIVNSIPDRPRLIHPRENVPRLNINNSIKYTGAISGMYYTAALLLRRIYSFLFFAGKKIRWCNIWVYVLRTGEICFVFFTWTRRQWVKVEILKINIGCDGFVYVARSNWI